jgi:hypothetical protein
VFIKFRESLFHYFIRFRVMRVIYVIFLLSLGFVAINIYLYPLNNSVDVYY